MGAGAIIFTGLLAAAVPVGRRIDLVDFVERARFLLDRLSETGAPGGRFPTKDGHETIHTLEVGTERVDSPLLRLEHGLLPWVTCGVMPVFALANAGVRFGGAIPWTPSPRR